MTGRELHWKIHDKDLAVRIEETKEHGTFHIGDRSLPFRVIERNSRGGWIELEGRRHRFYVVHDRDQYTIWFNGRTYHLERIEKGRMAHGSSAFASGEITALMPGKILRVEAVVGDAVLEGQTVGTMESMKMESALKAPKAGRITQIRCKPGQVVEMGELLIVIE